MAGFFLGKELSGVKTRVHGVTGVLDFLKNIRPFLEPDSEMVVDQRGFKLLPSSSGKKGDIGQAPYPVITEECSFELGAYEDNVLRVRYIPLYELRQETSSPTSSNQTDVAFLVELKVGFFV